MKIYIKEDKTKVVYKYLIVVLEFKNGNEDKLSLEEASRFFHMDYREYVSYLTSNFNGCILDYGPHFLCTDEVFYNKFEDAIKAKEWIESMFILREMGK
jgi:hypothetical protein